MQFTKKIGLATLLIVIFGAFITPHLRSQWTLKKDKNGVQVYTRPVEGSPLKEYRGIVNIKATVAAAQALILDLPSYTEWQHNCSKSYLLEQKNENDIYGYSLTDAPWPVQDREAIVRTQISENQGIITMKMTAMPDFIPAKSGVVRVPMMEGFWQISPQENGIIEVVQQVHASPGGSIPDWLANSAVVDTPYKTLLNMKHRLEGE